MRKAMRFGMAGIFAVMACFSLFCTTDEDYNEPINNWDNPGMAGAPTNMTIHASPSVLQADGSDKSIITVQVKNNNNNPIVGDVVRFSTDAGLVTAQSATDEEGKATAELTSDRSNRIATVTAKLASNSSRNAQITVEFSGVNMTASASPATIRPNGSDSSVITMILRDAANNVIVGERVSFTKSLGDDQAAMTFDSVTNSRGEARAIIKATARGSVYVTATAQSANASATTSITFSEQNMTITPDSDDDCPNFSVTADPAGCGFTARYSRVDGSPIGNVHVFVAVTAGTFIPDNPASGAIFSQRLTTDENGEARFTMSNPNFTGSAVIYAHGNAEGSSATASLPVNFTTSDIHSLKLVGTPSVIGTNNGMARITATASDIFGNRVAGEIITFNILRGPGGGERLEAPTAVTGSDGTASVNVLAGSIPSYSQGVWVVASTYFNQRSDTLKLTIAGPPASITVRRNINAVTSYASTYGQRMSALVSDVNGNPVPDGTEVTFSAEVTGYVFYKRAARFITVNESGDREWDSTAYTPVVVESEHLDNRRPYRPYPRFDDINKNGLPDSGNHVEPCDPYEVAANEGTDPGRNCKVFADYNGNGIRDFMERWDETDPAYRTAAPTGLSMNVFYNKNGDYGDFFIAHSTYFDIDWNRNGVPDPNTTILLTRTVQTRNGVAENEMVYGQSDAGRAQIKVWAEAQGLVTSSAETFVLPVPENARHWDPFNP